MIVRVLPPEEWDRLEDQEVSKMLPLFPRSDVGVLVVENDGELLGSLAMIRMTHLEGLWINPEHRQNPAVGRALLKGALEALKGMPGAFALAGAADADSGERLSRLGAVRIPMDFYTLRARES